MLELLFLLIPIAMCYGWYMGHRSAKKDQEDISNKFSRDYVTGVNFLLSNQQEKAVDLFLNILQKQENENKISTESQFEVELTLGNLFRSRGEVDRALRIHQALDSSPNYSIEQKLLAKQQLAKDFMAVGFYDRAEMIYISLVDEPEYAENALRQLALIYQKTKEWQKAINIAEKLAKIFPIANNIELAHYYCEYSENLIQEKKSDGNKIKALLTNANQVSNTCARASLLLGKYYLEQRNYQSAVETLEKILNQNPDFVGEAIDDLKYCYKKLQRSDYFESFLLQASHFNYNTKVELALADFIEEKDGKTIAQSRVYQQLNKYPNMFVFRRLIQYQIDSAEEGRAKESLILLHNMVSRHIKQRFDYRCTNCGYQTHQLIWCCPSCRQWETVKLTNGI